MENFLLDNWCSEINNYFESDYKEYCKFLGIDEQCFPAASVVQSFDVAMWWINVLQKPFITASKFVNSNSVACMCFNFPLVHTDVVCSK